MRALLIVVVAVLAASCASTGARPQPFPRPGSGRATPPVTPPGDPVAPAPGSSGYEITGTALALRGTPYRNGGADPRGFDCSGFVWYVFSRHGLSLPRTVDDQFRAGGPVDTQDLAAGDLVFFSTTAPGASHVGIIIGGDTFVHAPASSGVVRVERLGAAYWTARFVGARRVF